MPLITLSDGARRSFPEPVTALEVAQSIGASLARSALWAHEFGNVNAPITAIFSGAAAVSTFQVSGVELKRGSLALGLNASGEISMGVDLFVSALAEGNSPQLGFALFGGVRKCF